MRKWIVLLILLPAVSFGQRWIKPQRVDADTIMVKRMAKIGVWYLPLTDGTAGQVLTTNGGGVARWDSVPYRDYADSLSSMADYSDDAISKIPTVGTVVAANTAAEWIQKAFYPFVPATVGLSANKLFEVGVDTTYMLAAGVTVKSETVFPYGGIVQLTPAVDTILTWTSVIGIKYATITFNPIQSVADSLTKTFRAYQRVGNDGSPTTLTSSVVTVTSGYPYFFGMSEYDLTDGDSLWYYLTKYMNSAQTCAGSAQVAFNSPSVLKYAYLAVPSTCNDVSAIYDQNYYVVTNAFTKYTATVSTPLWTGVSYKIYRSNTKIVTTGGGWVYLFVQ